jgi:hypothetical protein
MPLKGAAESIQRRWTTAVLGRRGMSRLISGLLAGLAPVLVVGVVAEVDRGAMILVQGETSALTRIAVHSSAARDVAEVPATDQSKVSNWSNPVAGYSRLMAGRGRSCPWVIDSLRPQRGGRSEGPARRRKFGILKADEENERRNSAS